MGVAAKDIPIEQTIFTNAWNVMKRYYNSTFEQEESFNELLSELNDVAISCEISGGSDAQIALAEGIEKLIVNFLCLKEIENRKGDKGNG